MPCLSTDAQAGPLSGVCGAVPWTGAAAGAHLRHHDRQRPGHRPGRGRLDRYRHPAGVRGLPVTTVEITNVVGQDCWLQVRGIVTAWFWVHIPLHEVLMVAFGEAADTGEVAGEAGDA